METVSAVRPLRYTAAQYMLYVIAIPLATHVVAGSSPAQIDDML